MPSRTLATIVFAGMTALLATCLPSTPEQEIEGPCKAVYGGQICTWARVSGPAVLALGATVPMTAIENAPGEAPMLWPPLPAAVIPMPDQARASTGIDHLTVYWEPMGHPPGPFLTPHFDFHFYSVSDSARRAITCSETRKPDPAPPGYVLPDVEIPGIGMLPGLCVAGMGMHALTSSSMEATTPFTATMVLGYYDGKPIFFEPMVAQAALKERRSFSLTIPTLGDGTPGVKYPTHLEAVYGDSLPGYRFVFTGFSRE